jgi:hypothetical protein
MKSFIKWANALDWEQTVWWAVLLLLCLGGAYWYAPAGILMFLCVMAWMLRAVSRHRRGLLTVLLIASLFLVQTPRRCQAGPKKEAVVECNAVVLGGLILVVGGICIYKFVKFCQAHFPPPPPPNPPPTPPDTNAPPATNQPPNVTGYLRRAQTLSYTPTSQDISGYGWMDNTVATNPVPFQDFITLSFSSSTNLRDWSTAFTVNLWLSSNSVESVIYDANSVPLATNWCAGNPYTTPMTNNLPLPFNRSQTQLFFRDY